MQLHTIKGHQVSSYLTDATGNKAQDKHAPVTESQKSGGGATPLLIGAAMGVAFYGIVMLVQWGPLQRYFLGHPIALAATLLFWVAVAILVCKWWQVNQQWAQLETIRDRDLMPTDSPDALDSSPLSNSSPANNWLAENDAGFVARTWMTALGALPASASTSQLVKRLRELLTRQSQRGSSKHLADDLRELSSRDNDDAYDSLGLVRIIIWAIPMLGFLGTVIGITQTLGGLDFSNGTAAVDNLKSGLYVAFDTTALGLVLSVLAIFIQFPIESSEQRLLATIDHRVGHLVSACLPSDDASDNQTALIANLCEGIRAAVAESLDAQANLWRGTIDEAQTHWNELQNANANKIAEAFEGTLAPALKSHSMVIAETAVASSDRIDRQTKMMHDTMVASAGTLAAHHKKMLQQGQQISKIENQTQAIARLQESLDANLLRLDATNRGIDRSIAAASGDGMADAMRILARAVDTLSVRMERDANVESTKRRVA